MSGFTAAVPPIAAFVPRQRLQSLSTANAASESLTSLPNVQRLVSTLVMKNVINDRVLPL